MIFVALVIGIVLIVAAIRNSQNALFADLGQDVPGYVVWAAALVAVGAIGWIPGLKPVSRGLLALVLVVLIVNNYKAILAGVQAVAQVNAGVTPGSGATAPGTSSSTAGAAGAASSSPGVGATTGAAGAGQSTAPGPTGGLSNQALMSVLTSFDSSFGGIASGGGSVQGSSYGYSDDGAGLVAA
jgi:hypothetical protein